MAEAELKGAPVEGQAADQNGRGRVSPAWLAGWAAVLALAAWLSQLSVVWLAVMVLAGVVWTVAGARTPGRLRSTSILLLWATIGIAAGVQYRLAEVVSGWTDLHREIEDRSAEALGQELEGLLDAGERAVAGAAEAAETYRPGQWSADLFSGLDQLQRSTGVSAIALFDSAGGAVAWAGEHRGSVPLEARLGQEDYVFDEGPLFSYLYFVRPLPGGVTATAAFLLEASVAAGEGVTPFADRFERSHGARPRFWLPDRARCEAVWDWATDRPILSVCFTALTQQHWWERIAQSGRRTVALAGLALLAALSVLWHRSRLPPGIAVLAVTASLLIAPLGRLSGADVLFSPLQFVVPGPLDVTLGVLIVLLLGGATWLLTRPGEPRRRGFPLWSTLVPIAVLFPAVLTLIDRSTSSSFLAGRMAGGFFLQLATALLIAVPLFLLLKHTRPVALSMRQGLVSRGLGYGLPVALALGILLLWTPEGDLPFAAAALWAIPAGLLVTGPHRLGGSRGSLRTWLIAGWLAGSAALAFLWPMHHGAELTRAEREVALLGTRPDTFLEFLLRQFAVQAASLADEGERGVNLLYQSWVGSGLAREGYEARITLWADGEPDAELNLSEEVALSEGVVERVATAPSTAEVHHFGGTDGLHYLLVAPVQEGEIVSVAVPPRRRVAGGTPLARFLHPEQEPAAFRSDVLYLVPVQPGGPIAGHAVPSADSIHWVRTEQGWRSETVVDMPEGPAHAHLTVATSGFPLLLTRTLLSQAWILLVFGFVWLVGRLLCRELGAVPFLRARWFQSFRGRLSLALFIFFLLPTLVFGAVSYGAVAREVVRSAAALAQQALDQAAARMPEVAFAEVDISVRTDLLLYRQGMLSGATAPEILELGLFHSWLPPAVYLKFVSGEEIQDLEERRLAESDYLVAYRRIDPVSVLAAPIPLDSHEIRRRQQEFRDVALLVLLLGLGLSVVLSLLVSRALARPLDELSRAAATVGAGDLRTRLRAARSDEFGSVYESFNRMVGRLDRTRAALVQETRRTETIVAEAATGVLALDTAGRVELINPRAAEILGGELETGARLSTAPGVDTAVAEAITRLWNSRALETGTEIESAGRIVRLRLRRLWRDGGGGGAVVALEDVTAEVRAARVLAWGEMARQVAHEIKNPLTPIKLAVQHLRRAFVDKRPDFGDILDRNVGSILEEIDRLGEISHAFARFGSPEATASPLDEVDVARVITDTLALYRGSGGDAPFRAELPDRELPLAIARTTELKEVLVNLLENARAAVADGGEVVVSAGVENADWLSINVADTGVGIPEEQLPKIFEPHFSTRSSGTGLGLAIVRRIVDAWGGKIDAESEPGVGTRLRLRLRRADGRGHDDGAERRLLPLTHPDHSRSIAAEGGMTDRKKGEQRGGEHAAGPRAPLTGVDTDDRGGEFGTAERGARGTNRDLDESGDSMSPGHGHPADARERQDR